MRKFSSERFPALEIIDGDLLDFKIDEGNKSIQLLARMYFII